VTLVVAAVIEQDGRFLVTHRQEGVHLAGMWEFPGGKIDLTETHADGLRREIREELDADARVGELILATTHAYPEKTVTLYFYRCTLTGMPRPLLGQEMRWVTRNEMATLAFPAADAELITMLTRRNSQGDRGDQEASSRNSQGDLGDQGVSSLSSQGALGDQ
jgi:8-oxo-dGTP diphosphatase